MESSASATEPIPWKTQYYSEESDPDDYCPRMATIRSREGLTIRRYTP